MRHLRPLVVLAAFCLVPPGASVLPGVSAAAAPAPLDEATDDTGAIFSLTEGTLSSDASGTIAFTTDPADYTATADGHVLVGFSLAAAQGSQLDAGMIRVRPTAQPPRTVSGHYRADTPGGTDAATIATLTPGTAYEVLVDAHDGTAGAYRLGAYLAGDANADFQVGQDDLTLIEQLAGTRYGDQGYSIWSDVDRNGIVNAADEVIAAHNLGAATRLRLNVNNPLDEPLPDDALAMQGVDPQGFNPTSAPLAFTLSGADFFADPAEVDLTVNGHRIPVDRLTVAPDRIDVASALVDGRNDVHFAGVDTIGRPLYHTATVWTGTNALRVDVVDPSGAPVTDEVTVQVGLTDDQSVSASQTTSTGRATFADVPSRTVLVRATASGNRLGIAGLYAGQGYIRVTLLGFDAPSPVANNDFSQGTAGWDVGSAPVAIGPHVEGVPGFASPAGLAGPESLAGPAASGDRRAETPPMAPATPTANVASGVPAAGIVDNDLYLGTAGEGEQAISRTFTTDPEVTAVRVRYRFITSEVPGGWFGSEFNDYFRVSLRSQLGGGSSAEANSMNGLGLAAFDYASGATAWRDLLLPVDSAGDTIQVDLGVANVGDGLYDSLVVVDFVEEVRDQVQPSLAWNDTTGGMDLTYTVAHGDLKDDATIDVFWANGPGYANRLGSAIFSQTVPAGTPEGKHGPVHVPGNLLADNPSGVTHLIAVASPSRVGALADVRVTFGPNANAATVWDRTLDAVKDSLRAAGQAKATITSTARTPADQARAMFNNLVNPAHSIDVNVANQQKLYAPAGDAVIDVFVDETEDMTRQEILDDSADIRDAMEQEINKQGPQKVSRHCADPAKINVADIAAGAFNAKNGPLFVNAIRPRVTKFIDERKNNNCYHIELE